MKSVCIFAFVFSLFVGGSLTLADDATPVPPYMPVFPTMYKTGYIHLDPATNMTYLGNVYYDWVNNRVKDERVVQGVYDAYFQVRNPVDGKIREFFVDAQGNCRYKFANFTIYTPYFLQQGSYMGQVNIEDLSQQNSILTDQWEMGDMDVYFDTKASITGYHYPLRLTTKHRMMVTPQKVEKKNVNEDVFKVLDFVNLSAGPVDDSVFDVPADCELIPPKD